MFARIEYSRDDVKMVKWLGFQPNTLIRASPTVNKIEIEQRRYASEL
jgi:hypothetical protein